MSSSDTPTPDRDFAYKAGAVGLSVLLIGGWALFCALTGLSPVIGGLGGVLTGGSAAAILMGAFW